MNIHHYHPESCEYLWSGIADESPLEPGVYAIPAHATTIAPPSAQEGFVRRFTNDAWGYSAIQAPEEGPTEEPTFTPSMVDAERDRRIEAGFEFQAVWYQSRQQDRENMSGAAVAALAAMVAGAQVGDLRWHGGNADFAWIAADNTMTPMDAQTVFALGQAAMAHKQAQIFAGRALKDLDPIPEDYATNETYWP